MELIRICVRLRRERAMSLLRLRRVCCLGCTNRVLSRRYRLYYRGVNAVAALKFPCSDEVLEFVQSGA